jgi:hypothetical protein
MADNQALMHARFGIDLPETEIPDAIASLIDRRVTRRYTEQDVSDNLLDGLDRHHGLDRYRPGLPGLVRRHAARTTAVRHA